MDFLPQSFVGPSDILKLPRLEIVVRHRGQALNIDDRTALGQEVVRIDDGTFGDVIDHHFRTSVKRSSDSQLPFQNDNHLLTKFY